MTDVKVSNPRTAEPVPEKLESRQAVTPPTEEEVAALAYQLWIERGSPHGSHEEDWYQAEQQLREVGANEQSSGASA